MRTTSLQLFLFSLLIPTVFFTPFAVAQEYTSTGYYYNNFDGNQLGTKLAASGGAAFTISNTNLALGDGYSLSSTNAGVAGGYQFSFTEPGTDLNVDQGYEWTMLYKNNGGDTDNSKTIDNNKNSWRYWLFSNNTNLSDMQGYYLTQNGSKLEIMIRVNQYDTRSLLSFDLGSLGGNNTTYAIRVQRVNKNGQSFRLFVDTYTSSIREATTLRVENGSGDINIHNKYNYSGLEASSTSAGRFQFDELKLYSRKLEISGANDSANGFSSTLYDGQKDAVIYALKFRTRGLFTEIYQIQTEIEQTGSSSFADIVENPRLFRSNDNYFGNSDDVLIDKNQWDGSFSPTLNYRTLQANNFQTQTFHSVGTVDGLLVDAGFLFFKVDIKSDASQKGVFSIKKLAKIGNDNANVNFITVSGVVGGGTTTPNSPAGKGFDWVGGTSNDWSVAANWLPSGVPGPNDLARIGVSTFTNQPTVSTNKTIGNIIFGTTKVAILTVNAGATLTVKSIVENQEGITIDGAGSLTINGSYLAKPTVANKITTSSIANLSALNVVLNTQGKAVTFNANGANNTIINSLQTIGSNTATLNLANGAILTLSGALPFNLGATSNAVTLSTGSTVVYGADVQQTVKTGISYSNLTFSGGGIKKVAGGTLTVVSNWTSSGGKVDLVANAADVDFTGATQSITDLGSDAGNGVVFKNVKFSGGGTKTLSATGKFAVEVGSYLTMSANTILQTGDNLTLKAGALGSASVSAIPANSSIQGQVRVEKYIQGGSKEMWRTNRMLSSPVYDNFTGDRTYSFSQFIDDMIITGKGGEANGFDMAGSASAWTYVSGKSFVEIPNINTSLKVGMGAYLFYRGDRTNPTAKVTAPFLDAESVVMDFKGTLNQQDVIVPLAAANLVGNPYAATIDWNAVTKTGTVSQLIRIWNPSNRQYATFNGLDGVNGGNRYIGPGQAFFVQATGTDASLTFTENSKISNVTQSKPLYNVIMSADRNSLSASFADGTRSDFVEEQPLKIRAKLLRNNTENSDETLIVLKAGELATVNGYDVARSGGEAVFLSSLSAEGKQMAINYMPNIAAVPSVKLGVTVDNSGDYELQVTPQGLPVGYDIKLKDHYLNTLTPIDNEVIVYQFSVNRSDKASFGMNRFEIMLSPQTTLPVIITSFNAAKTNEGVSVKWTTSTSTNHSHFIVQRAGDNNVYTNIGSLPAQQNGVYYSLDKTPLIGNNYYRLVQVDKDGKTTTNEPIVIKYELNGAVASVILVYPTITTANYTLKYNGILSSSIYQLKISDVSGKTVFAKQLQKTAIIDGYQDVLPSVASGVYFIELIDIAKGKSLGVTKLIKK